MSAADEIYDAIDKLVALKAASTPPTGGTSWYQGRESRRGLESAREIYSGRDENEPGSSDIAEWVKPEDATLIVTLHATIDAQLAVLRVAWEYGDLPSGGGSRFIAAALTLARAINNGGTK